MVEPGAMRRWLTVVWVLGLVGCGGDGDGGGADDAGASADAALVGDGAVASDGDVVSVDARVGMDDAAVVNPLTGIGAVTMVPGGPYLFVEGPVWLGDRLLFSDIDGNIIRQLVPPSTITTFRMPSGNSNGLAVDAQGRLLACEHGNHRVSRTLAGGTLSDVATSFGGTRLNSPNDVIARSDGNLYFTDPDYAALPGDRQPTQGVFRVSPTGTLTRIAMYSTQPNGIALSPDEATLYVADASARLVRKFAVAGDGSTGAAQLFVNTANTPDGMAMDDAGNLFVSTQAGVQVFAPSGTMWGTITVPEQPANCTFGDADRRTLYITARTRLYRVRLVGPGKP